MCMLWQVWIKLWAVCSILSKLPYNMKYWRGTKFGGLNIHCQINIRQIFARARNNVRRTAEKRLFAVMVQRIVPWYRELTADIFLGACPTTVTASFFTGTAYGSVGLPLSPSHCSSSPRFGDQNALETWCPRMQLSITSSFMTMRTSLVKPSHTHACHYNRQIYNHQSQFFKGFRTSCQILFPPIFRATQ